MSQKQNVKAVILAGSRDFGRCPLASRLPVVLWPVMGRPVLENLLRHLSYHQIKQTVICSSGNAALLQRHISGISSMQIKFLDEPLPSGTAGCIRDATGENEKALLIVFCVAMVSPPNIDRLLQIHRNDESELTVVFEPATEKDESWHRTAGIYICEPAILKYIPSEGYCDIKEGLIPNIVRDGKTVRVVMLSQSAGGFRDRAGYLAAVAGYLKNGGNGNPDFNGGRWNGAKDVWLADSAKVAPGARVYGPVAVMDKAVVLENAIIFGPAIIGRNVTVGKNSFLENSIFWDGAIAGQNCDIRNCVVECGATIPDNSIIKEEVVIYRQVNSFVRRVNQTVSFVNDRAYKLYSAAGPLITKVDAKPPGKLGANEWRPDILQWAGAGVLVAVFVWSYWLNLVDLWGVWRRSDEYSSGLLVPLLALYVLWSRRREITWCNIQPSVWGLFAFVLAQAVRYFGLFFMYSSAERLAVVLSIASLVLLLFGWQVFRKVLPVLLFLCLMLPLPQSVHSAVMLPLQSLAAASAVFCLEILGYVVTREGNVIHLSGVTVAIAEACNGLRMVTSFFVITGLVVLLSRCAWWEKLIVLVSSVPIALLCNTVRLTVTAVVFTVLPGEKWERVFHNFGGYAMMPLALIIVVFELWILAKLTFVPVQTDKKCYVRVR